MFLSVNLNIKVYLIIMQITICLIIMQITIYLIIMQILGTAIKVLMWLSSCIILKCAEYQKKPSCKMHMSLHLSLLLYYLLGRRKRENWNRRNMELLLYYEIGKEKKRKLGEEKLWNWRTKMHITMYYHYTHWTVCMYVLLLDTLKLKL